MTQPGEIVGPGENSDVRMANIITMGDGSTLDITGTVPNQQVFAIDFTARTLDSADEIEHRTYLITPTQLHQIIETGIQLMQTGQIGP
jgi:hypothetical protein